MNWYEKGLRLEPGPDASDKEALAAWCEGVWERQGLDTGETERMRRRHELADGHTDFLKSMNGKK